MKSKSLSIFLFLACFSLIASSCSIGWDCVKGEGKMVEEQIKLSKFSRIEVSGSSRVFLTQGENQNVKIKAQANIIELLNKEVSDGEWDIKFEECIKTKEVVEIYITIPSIDELEIKGSGEIISQGTLNADQMDLSIKGSGEMKLSLDVTQLESTIAGSGDLQIKGTNQSHDISIKGSGDVSAYELNSKQASVDIKGSGNVELKIEEALSVSIYGSGDVYYKGEEVKLKTNIKGSGNISKTN